MADEALEHVVAEVATGLWRLQRRLDAGTPEARQVRRIFDVLGDADIRVDDHHGVSFDPGLAIDVVAFQPTEGIEREVVIETERPSIFRGAATLQRGRVIVGVPAEETT
jgi:hypothetical protein